MTMSRLLRNAVVMLLLMTVVTGIAYPLAVTGVAKLLFPSQANGSLIVKDGRHRLDVDRPILHRAEVLLGPPVGNRAPGQQRYGIERFQPGSDQSRAYRCGETAHRRAAGG